MRNKTALKRVQSKFPVHFGTKANENEIMKLARTIKFDNAVAVMDQNSGRCAHSRLLFRAAVVLGAVTICCGPLQSEANSNFLFIGHRYA